jgi:hypothetical protein
VFGQARLLSGQSVSGSIRQSCDREKVSGGAKGKGQKRNRSTDFADYTDSMQWEKQIESGKQERIGRA